MFASRKLGELGSRSDEKVDAKRVESRPIQETKLIH